MIRRNARLRRDYLYKKSIESQERATYERKQRLKEALESGKPIPRDLRGEDVELRKKVAQDDDAHAAPKSTVDDEYARLGVEDPKVLVTTSRNPSTRLMQFAKEVRMLLPTAQRVNRGNYVVKQLVEACRSHGYTDLVIVHEHRGEPDGLVVSHMPYGPTAYFGLANVVMRHDIPDAEPASEALPHLVFHRMTSAIGQRVMTVLKALFPVPRPDSHRVITFANQDDFIQFRHHVFKKTGPEVKLSEIGPRFDMRLYKLRLGTIDMVEAQDEWVLRPYMNTAKRRHILAKEEDDEDTKIGIMVPGLAQKKESEAASAPPSGRVTGKRKTR